MTAAPGVAAQRSVEIVEVGPRDGLQNEQTLLPTDAKVELIRRSLVAGVRRVEATSFVHPRPVPQAEQVARREIIIVDKPESAQSQIRIGRVGVARTTPDFFTRLAAIYQAAVADGRTDLWGTPLRFIEPESEHSSASAAEARSHRTTARVRSSERR